MAAKKGIDNLIAYYNKYNNLCDDRASIDNLGLLKAAAVCEIIHKEKERSQNSIPIVKSELTKGIFEIVSVIREEPFRRIKMPSFIDLPPNLVPHLKLGIFHFMFFNVARLLVLADGYSMSYAA